MQEEKHTTTTVAEPVETVERPAAATTQTVTRSSASGAVVARRVVYYIGGIIVALIAIRFVLLLLGANRDSGFVDFIYTLSSVFVAPFAGIFGEPTFGGSFYFDSSALVAIVIYGLVTIGIGKLFTLNRPVN